VCVCVVARVLWSAYLVVMAALEGCLGKETWEEEEEEEEEDVVSASYREVPPGPPLWSHPSPPLPLLLLLPCL